MSEQFGFSFDFHMQMSIDALGTCFRVQITLKGFCNSKVDISTPYVKKDRDGPHGPTVLTFWKVYISEGLDF